MCDVRTSMLWEGVVCTSESISSICSDTLSTGLSGEVTTKLTTYWLDVLGRLWTMRRQEAPIQGQFGRLWTSLDSAPSAPKPQVAGSIPVPPASHLRVSSGLQQCCEPLSCKEFRVLPGDCLARLLRPLARERRHSMLAA